jgi:hypothetical protein
MAYLVTICIISFRLVNLTQHWLAWFPNRRLHERQPIDRSTVGDNPWRGPNGFEKVADMANAPHSRPVKVNDAARPL